MNFEDATIISKIPYPAPGSPPEDTPEEVVEHLHTKGDGVLTSLLAMVSDCLYEYELDDDFPEPEMKLAYFAMKKSWETGGNTTPFLTLCCKNHKIRTWFLITLCWLMVLDRNNGYWDDLARMDFPEGMSEAQKRGAKALREAYAYIRTNWRRRHDEKSLTSLRVALNKGEVDIVLYGKKVEIGEPSPVAQTTSAPEADENPSV